jgi:hypothetical protein
MRGLEISPRMSRFAHPGYVCFPPPLRTIDDWVPPFDRSQLGLWEIESLRRVAWYAR